MAAKHSSSPVYVGEEDETLDANILQVLPITKFSVRTFVTPLGESVWVRTRKLEARQAFFEKRASGVVGFSMMKAAYESECAVHEFTFVPRPLNFGTYSVRSDLHFYICKFVDMVDGFPSPVLWAETAAKLHRLSMGKSPTRKFGFHCSTYYATVPIDNKWCSSWEEVWTHQMRLLLSQEEDVHGPDQEYSELQTTFFNVILPRYLRPLESDGRSILPCLIHSNLLPGNIKAERRVGHIHIFNSCAYWGHHEAELGVFRIGSNHGIGIDLEKPYIEEYLKRAPISEPAEDFDARNAIYGLKYHVLLSIINPTRSEYRRMSIQTMKKLVELVTSPEPK